MRGVKGVATPGPWEVMQTPAPSLADHGWRSIAACGKWSVMVPRDVAYKQWDPEANARLIATAPEMVKALGRICYEIPKRPNMTDAGRVAMMAEIAGALLGELELQIAGDQ